MMNIRKFFKVRNYYLFLGVIMINVGCTKNFWSTIPILMKQPMR